MKAKFIVLLFITACLTACGTVGPVASGRASRYVLNRIDHQALPGARIPGTLLVSMPLASPGYQTSRMLYLKVPYKLDRFATHHWVAPPAAMLQPLILQSLRQTQRFNAVVATPFSGLSDYRLNTRIITLHQEFLKQPSQVRLVVQFDLINNKNNRLIATKRIKVLIPTATADPYAGVIAANDAVAKCLMQLNDFVTTKLTH